jgi:hypothetical protein
MQPFPETRMTPLLLGTALWHSLKEATQLLLQGVRFASRWSDVSKSKTGWSSVASSHDDAPANQSVADDRELRKPVHFASVSWTNP